MSESPNLGAGSAARPDAARKKQLMAVGAAVAVALVAAVAYFGFIKGGSNSAGGSETVSAQVPHTKKSPSSLPTSAVAVVPAVYAGPVGRNPFKPLVSQPTQVPATSSTGTTPGKSATPTPTPPVVVIPTPTAKPSPTPTVTVTATPSPTGLPTAGQSITLTLVNVDPAGTADVTVTQGTTTTKYNGLKPGQVFDTYFKLVSILSSDPASPPVAYGADFQYGDQFAQLAKGDSSQFG